MPPCGESRESPPTLLKGEFNVIKVLVPRELCLGDVLHAHIGFDLKSQKIEAQPGKQILFVEVGYPIFNADLSDGRIVGFGDSCRPYKEK